MTLGMMIWALGFFGNVFHDDELREIRRAAARNQKKRAQEQDESTGKGKEGAKSLEEETEEDIALARRRREANDRYFSRVNGGVLDVVGRLEEVAERMRRVEMESRSIWSESASGSESLESPATGRGGRVRSGTLESTRSRVSQKTGSGG